MFSRSTACASRSANSLASICFAPSTSFTPIAAAATTRSRRHSSSKASCPPGGARGSEPAANTAKAAEEKRPSAKVTRKRTKETAETAAAKKANAAFANLPSVPMTDNLTPMDINLATFFSLHRPISVVHPIPHSYSKAEFNQIFESKASRNKSTDVMYTLSSAVTALEGASQSPEERDLRYEMMQQRRAHGDVAASEGGLMMNLEELVKQFRPFNVPPAPVPFDMSKEAAEIRQLEEQQLEAEVMSSRSVQAEKTYQTTVTIKESTSSNGKKILTASATPITERRSSSTRTPRQPFLARMAQRQMTIGEPLEVREDGEEGGMMLISVKRQRKLKMKKHKYKKLMKRTRNLRRKLGKT